MTAAKYCDRCGVLHKHRPLMFELIQKVSESADLCEGCQQDVLHFWSSKPARSAPVIKQLSAPAVPPKPSIIIEPPIMEEIPVDSKRQKPYKNLQRPGGQSYRTLVKQISVERGISFYDALKVYKQLKIDDAKVDKEEEPAESEKERTLEDDNKVMQRWNDELKDAPAQVKEYPCSVCKEGVAAEKGGMCEHCDFLFTTKDYLSPKQKRERDHLKRIVYNRDYYERNKSHRGRK